MFMNFFFFKQKTAYEMRISDWSSDVCSSDLLNLIVLYLRRTATTKRLAAKWAFPHGYREHHEFRTRHDAVPAARHARQLPRQTISLRCAPQGRARRTRLAALVVAALRQ